MAPYCTKRPNMYTLIRALGELRSTASQLPVTDNTLERQRHIRYAAVGVLKPSPPCEAPSSCI